MCFKSLFVPGVCCPQLPNSDVTISSTTTTTTTTTTHKPITFASIYYNTEKTTTAKPLQLSPVIGGLTSKPPVNIPSAVPSLPAINNYVDPEGKLHTFIPKFYQFIKIYLHCYLKTVVNPSPLNLEWLEEKKLCRDVGLGW